MTDESLILVDAVPDIREALETLDTNLAYTVSCQWPRTAPTSTLITITEIGNNQVTGKLVVDALSYQIDLLGPDADALRTLAPLVNAAVLSVGFLRTYSGPLELEGSSYYRKTMRFGRSVDKRSMRLVD